MTPDEIEKRLKLDALDRPWHLQPCCARNGDGLYEGLDWLSLTLNGNNKAWLLKKENKKKGILLVSGWIRELNEAYRMYIPNIVSHLIFDYIQDKNLEYYKDYKFYGEYTDKKIDKSYMKNEYYEEVLVEFLEKANNIIEGKNNEINDDIFMDNIKQNNGLNINESKTDNNNDNIYEYNNNKWDHFNFMRMIYILFVKHGRQNGLKLIWKYTPYNVTITYFWSQLIYFGIFGSDNIDMLNNMKSDFRLFLLMNPCLSNNYIHLIYKYYTKTEIKNSFIKPNEMILPNKNNKNKLQLPSMVTNIDALKKKDKNKYVELNKNRKIKTNNDDEQFLFEFENRTFKQWKKT